MPADAFRNAVILVLLASAATALLVGCGERGKAVTPPLQYPQPFTLTATEDAAHRSSMRIDAAKGGVVEAVDGNGTRYRLTIPPKAMLKDANVVLTPLSGISGVPGQTVHYGVGIVPAGMRLRDFALLEIEPAKPLPPRVYWLETEGPVLNQLARPGFPAIGKPGVLLWHFSGGSVVGGGPETSAAMNQGVSDAPGSTSWLEWQRNIVGQDFQAGHIDKITYDAKINIIESRIRESTKRDIEEALDHMKKEIAEVLDRETNEAGRQLDKAEDIATQGNLKDWKKINDAIIVGTNVDRHNQLFGRETDVGRRAMELAFKYYAAMLQKCDCQPMPIDVLLGLERNALLLGSDTVKSDFQKCYLAALAPRERLSSSPICKPAEKSAQREHVQRAAERVSIYAKSL